MSSKPPVAEALWCAAGPAIDLDMASRVIQAEQKSLAESVAPTAASLRRTSHTMSQRHRHWIVLLGMLVLLSGCGRIEIEHEESRLAIDALYTAVTSRRPELVDTCEQRLKDLEASGKLPVATSRDLKRIIEQARSQQWQPAAERLDTLIRKIKP